MKTWRLVGLLGPVTISIVSLCSVRAFADDAAVTPVLPAASLPVENELPPVVVPLPEDTSAPESPTRRDPTASLTVVDVAAMRGQAHAASEVVASIPSVVTHDRGGLLQTKTLTVRGAASNGVLVLLDGIPLNGAGGTVDLSRLPLALVERVELSRGAGSLYGSGAMGGVLNVVTRAPRDSATFAGALTYGSFGTALVDVSGSGALLGGQGLLILHGARSTGDFPFAHDPTPLFDGDELQEKIRSNNDVTMGGAMARYRRALSAATDLDATGEFSLDDRGLAGTATNPTPDARLRSQRASLSTRLTHRVGTGEVAGRAFVQREVLDVTGGFGGLGSGGPQPLWGALFEGTGQWLLGDVHGLKALTQVGYDALEQDAIEAPRWLRAAAAVQDEVLLFDGQATVVPSLRVDQAGPFTTFSPKLGASALLPLGFEVRANAGQAHRAPSFLELYVIQGTLLPNPDLQPERALTGDVGVGFLRDEVNARVTYFHSLYENLISYEYSPPLMARAMNINSARVHGLEAEVSARPSTAFEATASYTLSLSRNLRDKPGVYGNEIPYRPMHRGYLRASGGYGRVRARAEVDVQSRQFTNRTNTSALEPRAFVNLGLTGNVWKAPDVVASLDFKNVLDERSFGIDGYPLPGRAVYLTLSFSLDRGGEQGAVTP